MNISEQIKCETLPFRCVYATKLRSYATNSRVSQSGDGPTGQRGSTFESRGHGTFFQPHGSLSVFPFVTTS